MNCLYKSSLGRSDNHPGAWEPQQIYKAMSTRNSIQDSGKLKKSRVVTSYKSKHIFLYTGLEMSLGVATYTTEIRMYVVHYQQNWVIFL